MGTDTSSVIPMLRVQSKRNLKALVKSLGSEVLTFEPIHLAHPPLSQSCLHSRASILIMSSDQKSDLVERNLP